MAGVLVRSENVKVGGYETVQGSMDTNERVVKVHYVGNKISRFSVGAEQSPTTEERNDGLEVFFVRFGMFVP